MTTYQKLKAENLKLKQQLIELSTNPDSTESIMIKAEWIYISTMEEALWLGDSNILPKVFKGLYDQLESKRMTEKGYCLATNDNNP